MDTRYRGTIQIHGYLIRGY